MRALERITETDTEAFQTFHHTLRYRTEHCLQFIDITDEVEDIVAKSGILYGMVGIQTRHTTTAILVNELEPLLIRDMKRVLEKMAPREDYYLHDDFGIRTVNMQPDEKPNGHSHCKALFLKASETLHIADGNLQLGRWQRIFFIELDCERDRMISLMIMGAGGRSQRH